MCYNVRSKNGRACKASFKNKIITKNGGAKRPIINFIIILGHYFINKLKMKICWSQIKVFTLVEKVNTKELNLKN